MFANHDETLAMQLLRDLNMEEFANCFPHTLSGGQQQRIAIARALAKQPLIMLMDEPFANLDTILRRKIRVQIFEILKLKHIPTIVVTHDPHEALEFADYIYIISQGNIIQHNTPEQLYLSPNHPVTLQLLDEVNILDGIAINNKISSPLGDIPAMQYQNNTKVRIFIRPMGLILNDAEGVDASIINYLPFKNTAHILVENKYKLIAAIDKKFHSNIIKVKLNFAHVFTFSEQTS